MFEASRAADRYLGVIDIGSNSVRLVVFSGHKRVADSIFNEKTMCGLGAEIGKTGSMGQGAIEQAIGTLKRFRALCDQMDVSEILCVATAAVRDAKNGAEFVARVREECDLEIRVIEGEEEGRLAGMGVLSGEPAARGIVGDLGGGSLELSRVAGGQVHETISLPLGPLRLMSQFGTKRSKMRQHLHQLFADIPWLAECEGQNMYLVGGAWRNIAKLMMREKSNPLPILHGFRSPKGELVNYCQRLSRLRPDDIPFGSTLPTRRREVLPVAAVVLIEALNAMHARAAVVSSYGLREGLIFDTLDTDTRKQDPFLFSCHVLADERCRFAEHADLIYEWTRPLFSARVREEARTRRMHKAICLLGDIAWRGHPDFRAEKAVESVLHGNFVGVSHRDRAYLAIAMNQAYGAPIDSEHVAHILPLLKISEIMEARLMGAALRLAQRISGGAVAALTVSRLRLNKNRLMLGIPERFKDLANDVVMKRVEAIAQLLGKQATIEYI
ncbi:MAG: Ppx/GppA family phosphatase [Alphaproteobacteria bacterium]|nr:MAG: Ppx/GppA family phosphatase [Alphaproteobacteria bacterium]